MVGVTGSDTASRPIAFIDGYGADLIVRSRDGRAEADYDQDTLGRQGIGALGHE